jgi:DNA primase
VNRARLAPPRAKRPAPQGLERQIMRLLVAHPALLATLDAPAVAAASALAGEDGMLQQLVATIRAMGQQLSFAALSEQLRQENPDFDALIAEISAESESEPEAARRELAGALRQSELQMLKLEMEQLASTGLKLEDSRIRYRQLMARQEILRREAGLESGQL